MIITIPVANAERAAGTLAPDKVAAAVEALRRDGVVVLADAVDPGHVQALRDCLLADLPRVLSRTDAPFNFNQGNIQQSPPRDRELLFRDVWFNEQAIAVTSSVLTDPFSCYYSGNTALPGDQRQPVHCDGGHLWKDHAAPASMLVINLPLVDMSAHNGSIELWPGSHLIPAVGPGQDIKIPSDHLERRRRVCPPLQPTVRAGSLLIRDNRLWHAGMPNRSDAPRPMMAMIHYASFMNAWETAVFRKDTRDFFTHPVLRSRVEFRAGDLDHTSFDKAYEIALAPAAVAG